MNENLSRLMDGELDPGELDHVCAGLKEPAVLATWTCYHVIGETLRGTPVAAVAVRENFAARLSAEPTVLAPRPRPASSGPVTWAFAAAATLAAVTVVGWTAMSVVGDTPAAVAKAGEATAVRAERVRPSGGIPADYLLAHQEYSPSSTMQGPYVRAVGTQVTDAQSDLP